MWRSISPVGRKTGLIGLQIRLQIGYQKGNGLSEKLSDNLSDNELRTLALLTEDPGYTSQQIADIMDVSRVSVTKYLKTLKAEGLITRIGSDRKGYWKIN